MVGSGDLLIEGSTFLEHLRDPTRGSPVVHDGRLQRRKEGFASDVTQFDAGGSGVELFFCTMGGVPVEFMGGCPRSGSKATTQRTLECGAVRIALASVSRVPNSR
jgi:hypothetical protein